jgi:hypothetical protein
LQYHEFSLSSFSGCLKNSKQSLKVGPEDEELDDFTDFAPFLSLGWESKESSFESMLAEFLSIMRLTNTNSSMKTR